VEAGRFGVGRRSVGRGTLPVRNVETDALELFRCVEIGRPLPDRDGDMDGGTGRRDGHLLAAAPHHRTDIAVDDALALGRGIAGLVDLGFRVRNFHAENAGRFEEARRMFGQLVDPAVVETLALEDAGCVMQAMRQDVDFRLAPGHELAVEPKRAVALIEGDDVGHKILSPLPAKRPGPSYRKGLAPLWAIILPLVVMKTRRRE